MPARTYKSEGPAHYGRYQFGYCEWMEWEGPATSGEAYGQGFLPYSADPHRESPVFYMARSLRVNLPCYALDKKRRYDYRLWRRFETQRHHYDKQAFLAKFGETALMKANRWMENRFGEAYLKAERLHYILRAPFLEDVLAWTLEGELAAFALIVKGSWGAHYWYVFYKNDPGANVPPGHGYLIDFLEWCQAEEFPHAYLGTAYGQKSRYKSRGIRGIEFWDGNSWNPDKSRLSLLQEMDEETARKI